MASVTFKFVQNYTLHKDGTRLVVLRITYQKSLRRINTGIFLREKHFNPEGSYDKANWVRKSYGEVAAVNVLNGSLKAWLTRPTK